MKNNGFIINLSLSFLIFTLIIIFSETLQAWGGVHGSITKAALEAIPQWQKELWTEQIPAMEREYCYIPDMVYSNKELAKYAMMDDKPGVVYNVNLHLPDDQKGNLRIIEYYLDKVVKALKDKQMDEAAKYAGTMVHAMEDWGCPAHSVPGDNMFTLFKQFMPPPDSHKYALLHGPVEQGSLNIQISQHTPQLLGVNVPEAAYQLLGRCNDAIVNARRQVIPIIQAIYEDDEEALKAGQFPAAEYDAKVVADAIHTAFSIAYGRFDPREEESLKGAYISDAFPLEATNLFMPQSTFFSKPYWGFPQSNIILKDGKGPLPLSLNIQESGQTIEKQFEKGIGTGTNSALSYIVPEGVFSRFEAFVGLHSQLGSEGCVSFQLKGDDNLLFDSGPIKGNKEAQKVSVPIVGIKEIKLITRAGSNNPEEHKYNYGIWGEPKLIRE